MKDITGKWIQKADEDMKVVEHELKLEEAECAKGAVCFHAQQAAEKYLKAFLADKGKATGKTHDIAVLLKLCAEYDAAFDKIEAAELNFYAVQVRYPDDFVEPAFKEAENCAAKAKEIINLVKNKLK